MNKLFFDLETSSLSPHDGNILQIGFIFEGNGLLVEEEWMLKKDIVVSEKTTQLTGITQNDVDKGYEPQRIFARIKNFMEEADVIIGHNILKFDIPFLRHRIKENLPVQLLLKEDVVLVDTAILVKGYFGGYKVRGDETLEHYQNWLKDLRIYGLKYNLDLCILRFRLEIEKGVRHSALTDIKYTKQLYHKLKELEFFSQFKDSLI